MHPFLVRTILSTLLTTCFLEACGFASPITRRAVINSDVVEGFPETVPSNLTGDLYLQYQPLLKVYNGCVPFPAVDANGKPSGGLQPTGGSSDGCSSSTGQVYARATQLNDTYAIMYSWYMPKDSPSNGLGHRHDWENAVVWLDNMSEDAKVLAVSASGHGGYDTSLNEDHFTNDTHPRIGYKAFWPVNHQLIHTSDEGGLQPLVAWESLTDAARGALSNTDFGAAEVPFKDDTFSIQLEKVDLSEF